MKITNRFILVVCCLLLLVLSMNYSANASELLLKEIRFQKASDSKEVVFFVLNDFYKPKVSTINGERPRLVCDFNIQIGDLTNQWITTNGDFIQRIRVRIHSSPKSKIRVVLDLVSNQNYYIEQKFYQKENIFALIVGIR